MWPSRRFHLHQVLGFFLVKVEGVKVFGKEVRGCGCIIFEPTAMTDDQYCGKGCGIPGIPGLFSCKVRAHYMAINPKRP